jgi:hypothetical protein
MKKNLACKILRLRRVALATTTFPPQCDPCRAFLLSRKVRRTFLDNEKNIKMALPS